MFKNFKLNILLLLIPFTCLVFCFNAPKNDDEKMSTIMISVKNTLSYLHYAPKPINDAYSKEVYKHYFEMVDPAKRYFLKSDMAEFAQHETKLDDYLNQGDLRFYKLTVDRLYQRVDELDKITQDILAKPIDLNEDETLILEPKAKQHPANTAEMAKEWKKYIKYNILQEMESLTAKEEAQREKKDSVQRHKLQDTIKLEVLTADEKRTKATQEVKELITDTFRRFKKRSKKDWFTVYMNVKSYIGADAQTERMIPRSSSQGR